MFTIAIANQKGGSGKTTTAVNLAACLAEKGKQVLLIDLDPQAQASTCFGVDVPKIEESIFSQLLYKEFLGVSLPYLARPVGERLMLVPSTSLTLEREKELATNPNGVWRLKESLEEIKEKYDFVLLDCPPSLGVLTHAALFASQIVLLTIETSFLALHGVGQLLRLIQNLETQRSSPLQVFALATLFDRRTNFAKAVLKDMRNYFQDRLLNTVIRQSSPLREASSFGKPITVYSRNSRGCEDYLSLAEEILERLLSVDTSEKRWTMDEIALFSHLYGEGKKTDQVLRALGLTSLDNLKSLTAKRLSKEGRIPVSAAKRLISKAEKLGELPLVVHGQTILMEAPIETPISEEALSSDPSEKSSEVTPDEVVALSQNPKTDMEVT